MWSRIKRMSLEAKWIASIAGGPNLLGLVLIGLVWTTANFHLDNEWMSTEKAAIQNSANLAGAFEEHLSRSLNEIDRSIKIIRANYTRDPDRFDLRSWLSTGQLFDDQTLQVSIISADGFIKLSSIDSSSSVGTDLRDREHFIFQANAKGDPLFISKPVIGRTTGKWSIQLTRRIERADGSFGGMIVVSLDPAYLARFYSSVNIGTDGYVESRRLRWDHSRDGRHGCDIARNRPFKCRSIQAFPQTTIRLVLHRQQLQRPNSAAGHLSGGPELSSGHHHWPFNEWDFCRRL